jgi:hypothetical protein
MNDSNFIIFVFDDVKDEKVRIAAVEHLVEHYPLVAIRKLEEMGYDVKNFNWSIPG